MARGSEKRQVKVSLKMIGEVMHLTIENWPGLKRAFHIPNAKYLSTAIPSVSLYPNISMRKLKLPQKSSKIATGKRKFRNKEMAKQVAKEIKTAIRIALKQHEN